jgi:hypothetical protein
VTRVAVSADGRWLAAYTSTNDGQLVLLDRETGRACWRHDFPIARAVGGVAFVPSGTWLVTTHADGRVEVWETATGKPAWAWSDSAGPIRDVQVSADGRRAVTDTAGATALVWSLAPDGAPPAMDALWDWLGGEDAAKAYRAVWLLSRRLDGVAAEVRKRFPPDRGLDPAAELPRLIADLGSPNFGKREAASRELTGLLARYPGLWGRLRSAADRPVSLEAGRRLDRILQAAAAAAPAPTLADIRRFRVLAAVELAATPAARRLLAEWAAGTSVSPLPAGAKAALDRLGAP